MPHCHHRRLCLPPPSAAFGRRACARWPAVAPRCFSLLTSAREMLASASIYN
jgi:hypothetical protein